MSDELMELPDGWEWTTFEELVINHDGKRVPVSSTDRQERQGDFPYYGASGIIDYVDDYLFDGDFLLIAEDGANLISRSTPIAFEATGKFWVNNHAHVVKPLEGIILTSYLRDYFNCTDLRFYISGSAQPKLNQKNLNRIPIPLPPINEQRRIVAKVEELRERSQKAREALTAIPALCDRFRQSVLAAAFRGDLTADWREQNPDVEWKQVTLGEIIKSKPRNGYSPKPVDFPTKVKSLTLSATTSGKFKPEHFKYINEDIEPDSYLWLNPGDILIQRSNTLDYVGTCAIYDGNFGDFIYPDLMMKIQVVEEKAKSDFVYYALSSHATKQYFKENATGTAGNMPKINQHVVMNTPITLPSINEQVEIVQRIQQSFDAINRFSLEYEKAVEQLGLLDRSILAKAFRGELVEQDPTDEPAAVLLERIRAEREQAQGKAKKPGKRGQHTIKADPP